MLRRIANDGRDAFYTGEVAEDMLAALNALGGKHTADDFAAVACTATTPICGTYKDIEVVEHPPNGQGATAILMLNILSQFDIAGMDPLRRRSASISRPRRPSSPMTHATASSPIPITPRAPNTCWRWTPRRTLAALIDPATRDAAAPRR